MNEDKNIQQEDNPASDEKAPPLWRSALAWVGGFMFLVVLAVLLTWLGTLIQSR
jgi:hypothetical protein